MVENEDRLVVRCQLGEAVCGWEDRRVARGEVGGAGLVGVEASSYRGFRFPGEITPLIIPAADGLTKLACDAGELS